MRLTQHSRERLRERLGEWNENEWKAIVKNAYDKGKTYGKFKVGTPIREYLKIRSSGRVRVVAYRNVCFIFSLNGAKNNYGLITAYPIPDWIVELENKRKGGGKIC